MLEQVRAYIYDHHLLRDGQSVLVGVSGGLDSMVLLHVLVRLGYDVQAAHVNYRLRGADSDADEAFIVALCEERGVPVHVGRTNPQTLDAEDTSLQAAARRLRYTFFADVAQAHDLPTVAVAHHRDDQVETLLLHLTRGAGPEGLAGMAPSRPLRDAETITLVRPMLGMWREQAEAYAAEVGLSWREDTSNEALTYQRNVVRHRILPMMENELGAPVRAPMARTAELMRAYVDEVIRPLVAARFEMAAVSKGRGGLLRGEVLVEQPPILQRRLVLEGLAQWLPAVERSARVAEEVAQLITSEVGQHVEFGAGRVWRTRKGLRFLPPSSSMGAVAPTALFAGRPLALPQGTLTLDLLDSTPDDLTTGGETVAYVDAERLSLPLTVRFWQPGDRLQPLGMTGTKRVSDLLTEAEVPPFTRPEVLVVTSDEAIVWVVGVRLSDRFKVRPSTRHVARIAFESSGNALPSG